MNRFLRTLAWIAAGAAAGVAHYYLTRNQRQTEDVPQALKHSGTVTLETDRLILRRFSMEDAEPMFRNWANDPQVTKFLQWKPRQDVEETEGILASWLPHYDTPDENGFYNWAIELKELGEPVGNIHVVERDDRARRAHIGYCLGRKWWHQGIMSEALSAVIGFLFDEGYLRVDSQHNVNNPNSGGVMKKCGMKYEGTFKGYAWDNSGIGDACFYSILKEDYQKGK